MYVGVLGTIQIATSSWVDDRRMVVMIRCGTDLEVDLEGCEYEDVDDGMDAGRLERG